MTSPMRAVAFDLGGVLVDVDHARGASSLSVPLGAWGAAFFHSDHHDRVSRGELAAEVMIAHAAARLSRPHDAVRDAWARVVEAWPGAAALLSRVEQAGLRVLVWSNTDPIHASTLSGALPWVGSATGLSFRAGAMKPEPRFYERALPGDLAPGHVLFLDDRADNVAAARAAGVRAVHIEGGLPHAEAVIDALLCP